IIFERFRQACTDILTDKPGGAGLGLAIANAIVRRHLGTIEVRSRPGEGATFRVRLPVVDVATLEAGFEATHPALLGTED
ncbi:MAG: ATP-binding protein, partial [Planctomycetota bacterium]